MWHRFLTRPDREEGNLFSETSPGPRLKFSEPPTIELATRVPEDVWGSQKKAPETQQIQEPLFG
jgi:hypothetical protein